MSETLSRVRSGPLSFLDVNAFHDSGWVIAPGFFTASEAADIRGWADEVTAMPETAGGHMVYYEQSLLDSERRVVQRIENFCPYHRKFDQEVRFGRLVRGIAQLLDGPCCLFKDKINFKMPGGAGFELHQDQQAGWSKYAPVFLTALVCIDEATIENGCLEMAEMPRRLDRLVGNEWEPLSNREGSFALVALPTKPGDVVFFDSYAPHSSKANMTNSARRILYLTYNRLADGDHRQRYFEDKRMSFPPDIERIPGIEYKFRV